MRSILIVRLGALGDVVHTMPVVPSLRRRWPDARIDWLVDPSYVDVVRLTKGVGSAIPFDPRSLMAAPGRSNTLGTIAELRRQRYDLVFDLQGLVKSAAAARLAGGGETVGFAKRHLREPAARFLYTQLADVPEGGHVIAKNLALVSGSAADGAPLFELEVPTGSIESWAIRRFGSNGYAVMNPGAGWPNKRWPAERFGQLAAAVHRIHGVRTLVVWGPGEENLARTLVGNSAGAAEVAPDTSAVDLFSLLRSARLMVAGDTGPLHIAAAVGTPVVALFGPTDPGRNGPWHHDDLTVSRFATCVCHYERQCRRQVGCIEDITVEDVAGAVTARLACRPGGVTE